MYGRRSLTRLELAAYVAIAAVLVAVLADRMLDLLEEAEHAMVQATLSRLYAGVNLRLAESIVRGEPVDPADWMRRDPVELARIGLPNHAGALKPAEQARQAPGNWWFDGGRNELVYLPRFTRTLRLESGESTLRFRVESTTVPGSIGFRVVPVLPYRWGEET